MADKENFLRKCFALTGSIGTGKSTVALILAELGAHILDTDLIAREVVEPGEPALDEIREFFGERVINDDGTLNRELLREEIIRDPQSREKLNSITHPRINSVVFDRIRRFNSLEDGNPVIVDVPLLFESGWDRMLPRIILVYVPIEVQIERLMDRDNLDRDTAGLTVAAQMSIEDKKDKASFIIDNSGTLAETRKQTEEVFRSISSLC